MTAITASLADSPAAQIAGHAAAIRRYDLDWLRIAAFGLLILYHMGMFYVPWDWHVKSIHAGPEIRPLMLLTSPWRLTLLFLISGVATRYMADRLAATSGAGWLLLRARSARLLLPLAFGMLVIVPPQTWCEIVAKLGWTGSVADFYGHYVTGYDGWRPGGRLLIVPTWNHLWFVAYLWVYTMLAIALRPLLRLAARRGLGAAAQVLLTPLGIVLLPGLLLVGLRVVMRPFFPETHALIDDWYLHAEYAAVFLFGYAIARADEIWDAIETLRWPALAAGLACYGWLVWQMQAGLPRGPLGAVVWGIDQWAWIVALLGFARRRLDVDHPWRRYLADAVFPFYILHQTVIVVTGHALTPLALPAAAEAGVILAATVAVCLAGYETVRRLRWLRPFFGLKPA
ncbi:acyltransferase [Ferrovibrio sp.]|uniref:acyltransferase family protein n=1 Tax=Ferrovibrio sp. TaxID=1917215 RepID=UPI00311DC748